MKKTRVIYWLDSRATFTTLETSHEADSFLQITLTESQLSAHIVFQYQTVFAADSL